jgi:dienelactone hydrolase
MQPSIFSAFFYIAFVSMALGQQAGQPSTPTFVPEKVEFESAPRPLGKLMEQRARARGEDPRLTPGDRLQGHLAKPQGNGPFPAIVLLHGCGPTAYVQETLPQLLASWGYVALSVDSLTSRKVEPNCTKDAASVDRASDAYGGLYYLAGLPVVDRGRIGVLGISTGGNVVLSVADALGGSTVVNPENLTFKAGVAYYPRCAIFSGKIMFPLLIMIGRNDQWHLARACEELTASTTKDSAATDLVIYPDAHHGFVETNWGTGQSVLGFRLEYDEKTAQDSLRRAQDFLARNLRGGSR